MTIKEGKKPPLNSTYKQTYFIHCEKVGHRIKLPNTFIAYFKIYIVFFLLFKVLATSFDIVPHRLLPCMQSFTMRIFFNILYDLSYCNNTLTNKIMKVLFTVNYLLIYRLNILIIYDNLSLLKATEITNRFDFG